MTSTATLAQAMTEVDVQEESWEVRNDALYEPEACSNNRHGVSP
jgi:hypothetical protein